jgi:hypothetical protein
MANTSLSLINLDIPALEQDFKTFMKSQKIFADYDWDGSNISALVRLLSYNTFKNGWYTNLIHAEGYIDSAQLRSSLVSQSKSLNYTPRSARSAKAAIRLEFQGTEPTYVIEKGRTFSSSTKGRGLTFSVPDNLLLTSTNNTFSFTTDLYEGPFVADSYVINYSDETQRFVLSNPNIDTRSLTVVVYENDNLEGITYNRALTLLDLDETSKVFFLQGHELGGYEVVFGDNVIGRRPLDGSTVVFDYRVTQGEDGNGARRFDIDFEIGEGVSKIVVSTVAESRGGIAIESNESIRYYAPRHFALQERAVSAPDYAVMLQMNFPEIAAITAYGGEDANPPQFGRVIIALDIADVDGIPSSKKDEYAKFLQTRAGLTIRPMFVEPQYIYLSIRSTVTYNINDTSLKPANISALVFAAVDGYISENLNDFDVTLRDSRLTSAIDAAHPAIVGNETQVTVYKRLELVKGKTQDVRLTFGFPLFDGYPVSGAVFPIQDQRTIRSSPFLHAAGFVYLTDNGDGEMWLAIDKGRQTLLLSRAGTVDYETGIVTINNLRPESYDGSAIKLYAKPRDLDIASNQDTILTVEADEIQIKVEETRE